MTGTGPLLSFPARRPPPEAGLQQGTGTGRAVTQLCSGRCHLGPATYLGSLVSWLPRAACIPWIAVGALQEKRGGLHSGSPHKPRAS